MEELRWLPFIVWIAILLSTVHWDLDLPTKGLVCLLSLVVTGVVFFDVAYSVSMSAPHDHSLELRETAYTAGLLSGPIAGILIYWFMVVRFLKRRHDPDPRPGT